MSFHRHDRTLWALGLVLAFVVLCAWAVSYWGGAAGGQGNGVVIGLIGGGATIVISLMHFWLQRDREFRALFTEMNERYDRYNNTLDALTRKELTQEEARNDVVDYMNLCAEEYFWYKRGRIDGEVWRAWKAGMEQRFSNPDIAAIARKELDGFGASFYGWEKLVRKMVDKVPYPK
jgi:hypothetical protein